MNRLWLSTDRTLPTAPRLATPSRADSERLDRREMIFGLITRPGPATPGALTRRSLLRAGAGAGAVMAGAALPAWARPVPGTVLRKPGSRPFPRLEAGTRSMPQIEHVVVLMMENHSFDNLLGMVPHQVPGREAVDGLTIRRGRIADFNRDDFGHRVYAGQATSPCQLPREPSQTWNMSHLSYDGGRNDGFVRASGSIAMRFWDQRDLPFTYSLVKHFPVGERYFSSVLAQTYPNRRYLFTGTSSGLTSTDLHESLSLPAANGTIWDRLDRYHVDWGIYYQDLPSWLIVPGVNTPSRASRVATMPRFYTDAAAGKLPAFTFLDPQYSTTSEENPQDVQVGERFLAGIVNALMHGPGWERTALFITYDEHGGYYDHVAPPRAIKPDAIAPIRSPEDPPLASGGFDRYGFRVPAVVVSPWARAGYTSRVLQDHTSILAFVQRKFNLPAMTFRDANANPMTDYFDFRRPTFASPPRLARAPGLGPGLEQCHAHGLNPPLPGQPSPV